MLAHSSPGVKSFTVDLNTEQVVVETTLATGQVQKLIENSGRMAILRGLGAAGKLPVQSCNHTCDDILWNLSGSIAKIWLELHDKNGPVNVFLRVYLLYYSHH